MGESPIRRVRRFTTEQPDACPSRKVWRGEAVPAENRRAEMKMNHIK